MSMRTITLQRIVESIVKTKTGKDRSDFSSHKEMISIAQEYIFDKYPIFDEDYRIELNVKIISHYYFREICVTPFHKWKFYLNESMELNMPYYNQYYESQLIDFDLFDNIDYTETLNRDLTSNQEHQNKKMFNEMYEMVENNIRDLIDDISNTQNQDVNLSNTSKNRFEDTPMSQLGNVDYSTDITHVDSKEISDVKNKGTQTQSTNLEDNNTKNEDREINSTSDNITKGKNTEDYVKKITGKNSGRSKTELLLEFRRSFINVDNMVIKMISDNFSGYYN